MIRIGMPIIIDEWLANKSEYRSESMGDAFRDL
jgi:hypothetical protein